ncbi:hypothetical protein [Polymorphobacter megasporae]|uniref:hypothetical protein n=1 Tax=Glacieibacterium megasporae TaxID=2835787 RepID=UPI001C1E20EA|nr:hypothetical protein [Polymorphobacter megasporae]UAJ11017.1 hypothetical protein KTC28_04705 [Polymorphobacter megasporae]
MDESTSEDIGGDPPRTHPKAPEPWKPMSPQSNLEGSLQREDARRYGDDEFDSRVNIIAGDRVPKHTPEADRARVARERGRPPTVPREPDR